MHQATVPESALLRLRVKNWLHGWQAGARWWAIGGRTRTAAEYLSVGLAVAERPFLGPRWLLLMAKSWGREQEQKRFVERAGVVSVVRRRDGSLCLLDRMMIAKETSRGRGWHALRPDFLRELGGEEETCM